MTGREKIENALNHKPGPVPLDIGSTAVTGAHVSCVAELRGKFGLEKRPVKVHEPYQMLGLIEDDLAAAMGADTVGVTPPKNMFGFRNENWKEWRTPWGQTVLVPGNFNTTASPSGDIMIYPEGDLSAAPSGHMPANGYFFDAVIRQEPIDEDKLNPADNTEEFGPVPGETVEYFRAETQKAALTGRAVTATFGGTAFGDIALVPATFLKKPRGIRDISEWYMSTVARQDYIHKVFSAQLSEALRNLERISAAVGDTVSAVFICGTDFGTQTGTFCSPETFRELYMPYYKQVNGWIHRNTNWKTFKHSCGAVEGFMELFIESGFDIINPVQCSASGMDPEKLKEKYGERLVFWGGGVDTQKILPFGSPEDVRRQTLERCGIFSKNGGFVFDAIHNIQAGTPAVNITAMLDALREFNSAGR
jgi:hypothetical protein